MGGRVAMFLVFMGLFAGGRMASGDCSSPSPPRKMTEKKINVGGSKNWTFGVDHSRWAFKKGTFYINDTLVFKHDPPSEKNTHPHNVYLLPDFTSFKSCNFTNAVKIADEFQGAGAGFEFKLKEWQPYYFACGEGNGFHCKNGSMKFFVMAQLRRWA